MQDAPCSTAKEFINSSESVISFISSAIVVSSTATAHQTHKSQATISLYNYKNML